MISLALAYLRDRGLVTALNILLIALGVASLAVLLLVSSQVERRFSRDSVGIDLVVGARTGELNLLLSSVFRLGAAPRKHREAAAALLQSSKGSSSVTHHRASS